jgi:hypothetical protein
MGFDPLAGDQKMPRSSGHMRRRAKPAGPKDSDIGLSPLWSRVDRRIASTRNSKVDISLNTIDMVVILEKDPLSSAF